MKFQLINLFLTLLNTLIFIYIVANTSAACFSTFQMSLSASVLFVSVTAQVISIIAEGDE